MILLNPLALGLFGLAGLIILAYFLRRRAQPRRVSALFLWEEAARSALRRPSFARRPLLLLLLQLFALGLLVLALAGLALPGWSPPGKLAILIDGSASMQARVPPEGKSRYELALEQAETLLAQAREVTVIQAQRYPRVLIPLTEDKARARELLLASRPTFQGEAPLTELLELLKGQAPLSEFSRIAYLTDHLIDQHRWENLNLPVEVILVGQGQGRPIRNLGLQEFSVRREPEPRLGYSAFLRVHNHSDREESALLTIEAEGQVILSEEVTLPPRSIQELALTWPWEWAAELELGRGGEERLTATLEPISGLEDDFPWDDSRYLVLGTPPVRVLWLGEEDRFLRGALEAALGPELEVEVEVVDVDMDTEDLRQHDYDLIVANRTEVPPHLEGNLLLVNSSYPPLIQVQLSEPREVHKLVVEAPGHPLLRGVELGDFIITRAYPARLPPGGELLLSADGLPALYLIEEGGYSLCYIGLDLRRSNIYLTVDFPILMRNLLAWLLPPRELQLEVGQPFPVEGPEGARPTIMDPQGRPAPLIGELPGFYAYELRPSGEGPVRYLAVNLPAAELAQLQPGLGLGAEVAPTSTPGPAEEESLKLEPEPRSASERGGSHSYSQAFPSPGAEPRPLWRWLALAGLGVLAMELWLWRWKGG